MRKLRPHKLEKWWMPFGTEEGLQRAALAVLQRFIDSSIATAQRCIEVYAGKFSGLVGTAGSHGPH